MSDSVIVMLALCSVVAMAVGLIKVSPLLLVSGSMGLLAALWMYSLTLGSGH